MQRLPAVDADWAARVRREAARGRVLRYVVSATARTVSARLTAVPVSSPIGALQGTRNLLAFTTRRYRNEPLVDQRSGRGSRRHCGRHPERHPVPGGDNGYDGYARFREPEIVPVIFLASFLVLFAEVALIRWMGAYIRLLSFFSNFILLASFLGIGLGCLLGSIRARLFPLFPVILAALVVGVYAFRIEVSVQSSGAIYFSSGTAARVVPVESTLLLPAIFLVVVAFFAALAQRMAREMSARPPLVSYTANIVGSLAGVVGFALLSWLELPPASLVVARGARRDSAARPAGAGRTAHREIAVGDQPGAARACRSASST